MEYMYKGGWGKQKFSVVPIIFKMTVNPRTNQNCTRNFKSMIPTILIAISIYIVALVRMVRMLSSIIPGHIDTNSHFSVPYKIIYRYLA